MRLFLCSLFLSAFTGTSSAQALGGLPWESVSFPGGREVQLFESKTHLGRPWHYAACIDVVGDVDGDGVRDFAVMNGDPSQPSLAIEIYSGRDLVLIYALESHAGPDAFVAGVGDIDQDGCDDVAVCYDKAHNGLLRIYSGGNGTVLRELNVLGAPAPAGDLNADGVPDILIQGTTTRAFSGADGRLLHEFEGGNQWYILFGGEETASLGDVNGDGHDDVAVSDPRAWHPSLGQSVGIVRVYSGRDGVLLWHLDGPQEHSTLGRAIAAYPDQDGDGANELLISFSDRDADGWPRNRIQCRSGASSDLLFELDTSMLDGEFAAIEAVSDCDGDGVMDILVGRFLRSFEGLNFSSTTLPAGAVYLYSGATLEVMHRFGWPADLSYRGVGYSVGGLGDTNGDGHGEILFNSMHFSPGLFFIESSVQVWSFESHLVLNRDSISASSGGTLRMNLDFPVAQAAQPYRVLMSGRLSGQTKHGVDIPLARDSLFEASIMGNYPIPDQGKLSGVLNGAGNDRIRIDVPPGALNSLVGKTYELAAVIIPAGQLAVSSSIARRLTILP